MIETLIESYVTEARGFTYGAIHRPIESSTVPKGYRDVKDSKRFKFGTLTYDKALPNPEKIGLVPLLPLKDIAKQVAAAIDYPEAYLEEPDLLADKVEMEFKSLKVDGLDGPVDMRKLIGLVTKELK